MPEYDPELVDEVQMWLRKAHADLGSAAFMLKQKGKRQGAFLGHAVFHAQQAAEKSIKAFRTRHSLIFGKTPNIEELSSACIETDATLSEALVPAYRLTDYAWKFRYPGEPENPTRRESVEAVKLSRAVLEAIEKRLPRAVRIVED